MVQYTTSFFPYVYLSVNKLQSQPDLLNTHLYYHNNVNIQMNQETMLNILSYCHWCVRSVFNLKICNFYNMVVRIPLISEFTWLFWSNWIIYSFGTLSVFKQVLSWKVKLFTDWVFYFIVHMTPLMFRYSAWVFPCFIKHLNKLDMLQTDYHYNTFFSLGK